MNRTLSFLLTFPVLLAGCSTAATTPRDCSIVPTKLIETFGSEDGYLDFVKATKRPGDNHQTLKINLATEYLARPDQTEAGKLFFLQTRARTYSSLGQNALSIADYKALALLPDIAEDRRQYFQRVVDTGNTPLSPLSKALPDNVREATPLVRVPPRMPQSFLNRDNSGHCALEFAVDPTGKVVNPTVDYCTHEDLREASLTSLKLWKYSPRTESGKAVLREGVQTRISFNLQDQCGFFFPE